ncbi:MAG: ATP synthase F1 subunit epsilon [Planctomycetes bacterium]|nr:ATP synthase F1 subunit epsilon [Planctomycetota bacterium]
MPTLTLRVITPDRIVLDEIVESVRLDGLDGSLGVLPRHAPMIAALDVGLVRYSGAQGARTLFCAGGFAEVHGDTLRVVTQASERPEDIDEARARDAEQRARERLRTGVEPSGEPLDVPRARAALKRALFRLQAKGYPAGA